MIPWPVTFRNPKNLLGTRLFWFPLSRFTAGQQLSTVKVIAFASSYNGKILVVKQILMVIRLYIYIQTRSSMVPPLFSIFLAAVVQSSISLCQWWRKANNLHLNQCNVPLWWQLSALFDSLVTSAEMTSCSITHPDPTWPILKLFGHLFGDGSESVVFRETRQTGAAGAGRGPGVQHCRAVGSPSSQFFERNRSFSRIRWSSTTEIICELDAPSPLSPLYYNSFPFTRHHDSINHPCVKIRLSSGPTKQWNRSSYE